MANSKNDYDRWLLDVSCSTTQDLALADFFPEPWIEHDINTVCNSEVPENASQNYWEGWQHSWSENEWAVKSPRTEDTEASSSDVRLLRTDGHLEERGVTSRENGTLQLGVNNFSATLNASTIGLQSCLLEVDAHPEQSNDLLRCPQVGEGQPDSLDPKARKVKNPSRHCHICMRRPPEKSSTTCSNISSGKCRKIICHRCFGDQGWLVNKTRTEWICCHCRGVCPRGAQCNIYNKNNKKRCESLKAKREKIETRAIFWGLC